MLHVRGRVREQDYLKHLEKLLDAGFKRASYQFPFFITRLFRPIIVLRNCFAHYRAMEMAKRF